MNLIRTLNKPLTAACIWRPTHYSMLALGMILILSPISTGCADNSDVSESSLEPSSVVALAQAHAHNDYYHGRPLLDALDQGFGSVEADIYRVDNALLVAHDLDKTRPDRTLQALYLEPLAQRARTNNFQIHRGLPTFYLLIDIKSDAQSTYEILDPLLATYSDVLTQFTDAGVRTGAVTVVLSGNRPTAQVAAQEIRWCGVDGRLSDLQDPTQLPPATLMPWISDNWSRTFNWMGRDAFPETERDHLNELVKQAHDHGRILRFWGHPDRPEVWAELQKAGVDLINTDRLNNLAAFLKEVNKPRSDGQ